MNVCLIHNAHVVYMYLVTREEDYQVERGKLKYCDDRKVQCYASLSFNSPYKDIEFSKP